VSILAIGSAKNCIMNTIYEDIAFLPFKILENGVDPMTSIGNENDFVSLGSYEFCEALADVREER
jgi:hypothetical protein